MYRLSISLRPVLVTLNLFQLSCLRHSQFLYLVLPFSLTSSSFFPSFSIFVILVIFMLSLIHWFIMSDYFRLIFLIAYLFSSYLLRPFRTFIDFHHLSYSSSLLSISYSLVSISPASACILSSHFLLFLDLLSLIFLMFVFLFLNLCIILIAFSVILVSFLFSFLPAIPLCLYSSFHISFLFFPFTCFVNQTGTVILWSITGFHRLKIFPFLKTRFKI